MFRCPWLRNARHSPFLKALRSSSLSYIADLVRDRSRIRITRRTRHRTRRRAEPVITIYGTGEGLTTPAGITGGSTTTSPERANLPVSVNIGGIDVTPIYAGAAGNSIEGLMQVNVVVPQNVTPGPAVPVVVTSGGVLSQAAVTIAVQ